MVDEGKRNLLWRTPIRVPQIYLYETSLPLIPIREGPDRDLPLQEGVWFGPGVGLKVHGLPLGGRSLWFPVQSLYLQRP